jgi:amino acid adenylation domain-containing protein
LFRYSEQKDILIGMPVSGRHMPQYENLVGLFVNTLVVRTTVDAQISFRELAARVWKNWIEAHTYQDVPFELLVRELAPKRDLSFSPIFQVMFSYYHQHDEILSKFDAELRLAQLSVKPFGDYSTQTSKFDFSFSAAENEDGYSIWLDFDTDLYSADRAEAILDHFMVLLHSAVTHPDLQVAKMPLVTKSERTMLMSWNNTDQRFSKLIICHSFQQQAIQRPNDVAVSYDSGTMTYREVSDSANYLAGQLISIGVKNGMFVPFLMEGGCLVPVAMLGTMKAGAAFVPLDLRWPQELLQHSMDQLNPKVLLCDSSCHHLANQLSGGIRVIEVKPVRDAVKIVESEISMTDPIYAIFTSGSTGDPKAVAVPHRGISNRFNWMNDYFGTEAAKSVLQTTRHVFDSAVWQLLWPLTNGGKTTILNGSAALNAETIADLIALNQVTITDFVPSVFNMIAPSVMHNPVLRDKLKTLRVLIVGGEEITTTTTLDFQKMFPELVIVNLYGPTEASIGSICYRVEGNETKIPIGKPIMNTKALIVNECGQLCPVGIAGEIVLLGECLGLGYLNDPASTQAAFVKNPFSEVKCARMYRTGDIGYFSADGNIHFIGRHDYQIKVRGHRIELGQIEAAILKYPEVKQTCVIVRHDNGRPMIVAYIAPICSSMTNDNMRRFLRTQVPDYMIPAAFVFLNIIPIGSNGKINRRALPIPDLQQLLFAGPARNPLSQAEKCIAAAWEDVLKLKIADVNANFFDVGGHSLLLPQLSAALSSRLNRTVSILDIFRYPTIADLANHLENTSITEVPKPVGFAINRTKDGVQTRMRRIRTKSVS